METITPTETIAGVSAVALIVGLVQVAKRLGLPSRFAPLLSLLLGIALVSLGLKGISAASIFSGLIVGLSASGLWSGTKALSGR